MRNKLLNKPTLKLTLAILLLACLLPLPYGYFQLVRFLGMAGFGYLAVLPSGEEKKNEVIIYIALALLFQPFFKIALGRTIWNIVDVIIALGLLGSIALPSKKQ
ncbi:DUF6804 family protein [Flavobacterium sp. 7A]|uniref:DUF6804 family protein n=1 Tax=Flavobacterium sp. 7A TaxID=2940571 RepID=UPI0029CAB96D|nr:DUF6804 family protein [Flavobacterium sp. 7A]MCW2119616.1 putative membrane channel-forming protein YqfA (hemolysin III family) [Flavobacterium sp. 7A]